jgi:hypothetical protein
MDLGVVVSGGGVFVPPTQGGRNRDAAWDVEEYRADDTNQHEIPEVFPDFLFGLA